MITYKIIKNFEEFNACILRDNKDSIPFAPDNTDYANFKREILADEAQLQDADGNLMTPQDAKDFVRTLP